MGNETIYTDLKKDGDHRKVVVVGAGPGGLEAAITLAKRDFAVTLFEKNPYLGGQLYLASLPPHKQKMGYFIQYAEKQLKDLGVDVRLGQPQMPKKLRHSIPMRSFSQQVPNQLSQAESQVSTIPMSTHL